MTDSLGRSNEPQTWLWRIYLHYTCIAYHNVVLNTHKIMQYWFCSDEYYFCKLCLFICVGLTSLCKHCL